MKAERVLPLHVEKAVLARVLVFQVLDLHHAELAAAGYGTLWEEVRDRLCHSTVRQLEFCSADPLSSYLHRLAEELRSIMQSYPGADTEKVCTLLLDEIDRVLADAGRFPGDLLPAAFDKAVEEAFELYRAHGLPVSPDMLERITVRFDHQLGSLHSPLPIQLTAVTCLHEEPGDPPSARVDVRVNAKLMDELTAFSLPYVLLHECVCHVFQGPWQGGRTSADPSSRFAEGWMDYVAFSVHQMLARSRHGGSGDPDLTMTPRAAAQEEAADTVHKARYAKNVEDRAWAQRALGVRAAHNMRSLLERLPEARADPLGAFVQLSVHLNASPIDNQQRDLFVAGVSKATLRGVNPELVPVMRRYLTTHDLHGLVGEVLKLFT
ncbi:hypothetical protein [Couchioplanes caeruleus]|uniref:Uncharacterized protein n=2 Tax=Couchioplanes caeruleus TaxID=56438 RepID=A0A1K0GQ18_9ACTN|nr:hypothetical protein [Couchioplanes caeruleus]OJF14502.1 hypothetical protein BG844_09175 [Couchioplanes caeruleus subsp. caeruleus]ROP21236.1 hypothetical protein EDD30_7631 [Couchioplanes caeruleus]